VAPNAVDVRRKGRTVVVDVRATDAQSGVAAVDLEVGTLTTPLPARLVAGTRHDGVWRTTLEVGRCDVAGDWMVRVASIADRRGHAYDGYAHPDGVAGALTVVNADRVAPTIASQKEDTDSLQVDFTEDVVGIGDTGAAVYSAASPLGLGDRLTGSWQCADAAGAQADCLRGPVRTATFAADQPFPAGSRPGLVLNPEHVLDVTDLAGNPAGDARRVT
jgi:hypothetical protein